MRAHTLAREVCDARAQTHTHTTLSAAGLRTHADGACVGHGGCASHGGAAHRNLMRTLCVGVAALGRSDKEQYEQQEEPEQEKERAAAADEKEAEAEKEEEADEANSCKHEPGRPFRRKASGDPK